MLAAGLACATGPPGRAELDPLEHGRIDARTEALPDELEVAAGRLAAMSLADRPDTAAEILASLRDAESGRLAAGAAPSGLIDQSRDLLAAMEGPAAYAAYAERALDEDDLDPVLRRRLETWRASQPLRVAEQRLAEDRRARFASIFNRVMAPISRLAVGTALNPIEAGRAALASALVLRSFPEATTQERQALRAYKDFLDRNPDAPEAPEVVAEVEKYQQQWIEQLHGEAIDVGIRALDAGQPEIALYHLDRAERLRPDDPETSRLRAAAFAMIEARESAIARSVGALALVGVPLDARVRHDFAALAASALISPLEEVAQRAAQWDQEQRVGPLQDEVRFFQAFRPYALGYEDAFFDEMAQLARLDASQSNMARHAARLLSDSEQNPYAFYRAAKSSATRRTWKTIFLGSRAGGPIERNLPAPLEWLIDVPGFVTTFVTFPLRLVRYPSIRQRYLGPVLHHGEQYLAHFPRGEHAEEVREHLESLYAYRDQWTQALEVHRGRKKVSPRTVVRYRERIAERRLEAARQQRRIDARAAIYRSVIDEFPNTASAGAARGELRELLETHTAQQIRLTRAFLLEHPELWAPDALGIRPQLLDGDDDDGELADEGVTLVGRSLIQLALEDREPVTQRVPRPHFARFVALLEEVSYRTLATDAREQPAADPQRDLFFERARLGLLDEFDNRPSAMSTAVFESSREKHGLVRRRESILPVELVLQGGLEDFAFSAFPRVHPPRPTDDAFLYR